jgi:hypothetical protein
MGDDALNGMEKWSARIFLFSLYRSKDKVGRFTMPKFAARKGVNLHISAPYV